MAALIKNTDEIYPPLVLLIICAMLNDPYPDCPIEQDIGQVSDQIYLGMA
jgi:hypothetical protein